MYTRDISPNVLAQLPALPPPLGVKSNFDNPPNHDASLIVTNTFFLAAMLSVVTIRIYTRSVIIHEIGWDDCKTSFPLSFYRISPRDKSFFDIFPKTDTSAMAAAVSVITSALTLNGLRFGYGRHLWDIRAVALMDVSIVQTIASMAVVSQLVIFLVKISILLQYLRLFGTNTRIRKLVYFGLLFIILFHISSFGVSLSTLVVCNSPKRSFTYTLCKDVPAILVFQGVFNILSDFYIFLIPIPCIIKLQISKRQKIGLLLIFLTGFVTCLVSIARVINVAITFHGKDTLWNASLTSEFT
jgi:hypothetical protein